MLYWKTITTYLLEWDPSGIKTVELSNWIWKAIIIPRAKLKEAKKRKEMQQVALYFLFWLNEQWENKVYIWQSENLIDRIWFHDLDKDFWDVIVAFIWKENYLTKADVKYLESKSIERAKKINRYILENWVIPVENCLPEHQKATMDKFFDNIDLLTSVIWYPILKEIENIKWKEKYYLTAKWAEAEWIYTWEWFIVLKWSKISNMPIANVHNLLKIKRDRERLISQWVIVDWIFTQDYSFGAPSTAANLIAWGSLNWWIEWKNKNKKTLNEMERKNLT